LREISALKILLINVEEQNYKLFKKRLFGSKDFNLSFSALCKKETASFLSCLTEAFFIRFIYLLVRDLCFIIFI